MPIGNLTSQILANIYLNELDRFIVHTLKPLSYLRYGDDFVIIVNNHATAVELRQQIIDYLNHELQLDINHRRDEIRRVKHGLEFLGVQIFATGRRLNQRNDQRITQRLNSTNISSYVSLLQAHAKPSKLKALYWHYEKILGRFG